MRTYTVMISVLLLTLYGVAATQAQGMKPLSAADNAKTQQLLKSFDPNSYRFNYQYKDVAGKVHMAHLGTAKGLANLRQGTTTHGLGAGTAASTNTSVNVFARAASTNTSVNVFARAASTNTNVNVFANAGLNNKAAQLNQILKKY